MSSLFNPPNNPPIQRPSSIQGHDIDPTTTNVAVTVRNDPTYGTYRKYADGTTQGRQVTASVVRSAAIALTTGVAKTILSIVIPRNSRWRIVAIGGISTNIATLTTGLFIAISKTTNTLPAGDTQGVPTNGEVSFFVPVIATGGNETNAIVEEVFENTTNQDITLYLVERASFTVNTCSGYGSIFAVSEM